MTSKLFLLFCLTQVNFISPTSSQYCSYLEGKYLQKLENYEKARTRLNKVEEEINDKGCVIPTTTTMEPTTTTTPLPPIPVNSVKELFDTMIHETNTDTDWAAEKSELDRLPAVQKSGKRIYLQYHWYNFKLILKTSIIAVYNMSKSDGRRLLSLADSRQTGELIELWFDRKDGGIGWCKVGFARNNRQVGKIYVAYNCVSIPVGQNDNRQTSERLLKFHVHDANGKFDQLFRVTMMYDHQINNM